MNHMKKTGLPVLSMVLVCFYPCAFLFFQNAGEARAVDMLPFFGIFLLTAAGIFLIADVILRNVGRAAVLTDLAMLAVINFTMICNGIKKVFPGFRDKILLIAVIVVLAGLLVLFWKKKPNVTVVCGLVALMFGGMTLVNFTTALPTLIAAASYQREEIPVEAGIRDLKFSGESRNVYYMIFDEYGGPENLMHFYEEDNETFLGALEERGFSASRSSKNTESPWTVTLVPNMMNLNYVTSDDIPINNRLEWLEDPVLYQLFRNNGYQINLVNQEGFLGETGCRVLNRRQTGETISVYLYENSIFCLLPKLKWVIEEQVLHRGENGPLRSLEEAAAAMESCWEAAQDGPTLTVVYLTAPHAPFLFDETGAMTAPEDHYNWEKPELYLAKLQYINAAILRTVDNIQTHDPEAVILLQADHGARIPGHLVEQFGGPWFDTEVEIPFMENVLNCAYVPERIVDVEGETCINTTRKVLDAVFGLSLGALAVPEDYTIPEEFMPPPPEEEKAKPSSAKADQPEPPPPKADQPAPSLPGEDEPAPPPPKADQPAPHQPGTDQSDQFQPGEDKPISSQPREDTEI